MENMRNKKICVIGGLGFIGRNLTEILDKSNQITILDIGEKPKYLSNYIEYVDSTINNLNIFKKQYYDFIFYFAGNSSVGNSVSNPVLDLEKNTFHLLNLLEIIKNSNSKFIFASSAACYGEMKNSVTAHNDEPISPYGISKLFSEKYLEYYNKHYGLQILICRFFSPFGEYNLKQVIYDTTLRLLKNQNNLMIFNPNSRRDFIYIGDAIKAMLFLCDQNQFNAEIFDIGRGKTLSIFELTEIIQNILNIHLLIEKKNKNFTGDPAVQTSNINKLKVLGFDFSTSTIDNLRKTINWIKGINK
jgi:UDP-glucose 4-epimerase